MCIVRSPAHVCPGSQAIAGTTATTASHFPIFAGHLPPIFLLALCQRPGMPNPAVTAEIADLRRNHLAIKLSRRRFSTDFVHCSG
jgi:hypothetical protein